MVLLRNAFPLVLLLAPARSLENGVGATPPMGFNPWNCFGISSKGTCKLPLPWLQRAGAKQPCHGFNESVIMGVARAIEGSPLKAAGYEYVNLDCGYSTGFRGEDGSLTVNLALDVYKAIKCRFQSKRAQIYIRSQLFSSTFKYIAALKDFNMHA